MKRVALLFSFILAMCMASSVLAVLPGEVLSDPKLEARARTISQELRCVVCQNQSIDDSDAPLAGDMRVLVRDRLLAGDSDQQVKDYLVARYGNFVLLNPPMQQNTLALWFGPLFFVLIGFLGFGLVLRRNRNSEPVDTPVLTDEEKQRLKSIASDALS